MSFFELLLTALALAMDAFAVSVANGTCLKKLKLSNCLKVGAYFGGFQFLMPIIGYIFGKSFLNYITKYDRWVAFFILVFVGMKMFKESFEIKEEKDFSRESIMSSKNLTFFAIATSIDALAVGVSLAVTKSNIIFSSITIGIVAFALSSIGVAIGKKVGSVFKSNAERIGGIVLILIGFKMLLH